jgi:hypothetical protein
VIGDEDFEPIQDIIKSLGSEVENVINMYAEVKSDKKLASVCSTALANSCRGN